MINLNRVIGGVILGSLLITLLTVLSVLVGPLELFLTLSAVTVFYSLVALGTYLVMEG